MRLLKSILVLPIFISLAANSQSGDFTKTEDIGSPQVKGSTSYSPEQVYTIKGGGTNIWDNKDEFHYAYNTLKGDFILTADFTMLDTSGDNHRKTGWMVRASTDPGSAHISAALHGDGLNVLQWRQMRGAYMRDPEDQIIFPKKKVQTVQLERKGKTFIMRLAPKGEPLQEVGRKEMPEMPDSVLAGIYACAHHPSNELSIKVWNVRVDKPLAPNLKVTSRLEYIDVADGSRRVIYKTASRFEAPNYMPGGKLLLYNQGGLLYTIAENGGEPTKFNTGAAVRNNNDHGISFDGKFVVISSHREGLPGYGSTIYTVPIAGGEPKMVSDKTPSYWHGVSPDGKYVLAIGQRGDNVFNVYKISVADGSETNLTKNKDGHVDGSEYTPDGKWIYFNWNVSGTMQIWRMKPDGTQREQLTFDEYNNWFPHISPDGKWICIISFQPDINPNDHPADKKVMLRLMPVNGGAPKVLAHIYGGQGTINVPSWSPDSKRVAFVSYTY